MLEFVEVVAAKMWPTILLLCFSSVFSRFYLSNGQESSGDYLLSENGTNASCVVPAYSQPLYEVNSSLDNVKLLLVEGRCYLLCLTRYSTMITNVDPYPIWPFAVLKEDANCYTDIAAIHECTRGCRLLLMNESASHRDLQQNRQGTLANCRVSCNDECRKECGGENNCRNPDSIDLWVARTGCINNCHSRTGCLLGCLNGEDIIIKDTMHEPAPPPPPVAPPTLIKLNDSTISSERGLYWTNLTNAAGNRNLSATGHWNGFLFRIEDLDTNNVTYIWQHDPRNYLNLSSHICRTIEVSFCVVNPFGASNYSDNVTINIEGDARQLPNAAYIQKIDDSLDDRTDFFQHVVINVTWESPQDDTYLMSYEVSLHNYTSDFEPDYCKNTNNRVVSKLIEHTSQKEYSMQLVAEAPADYPVMGCNYTIRVTSIGLDGNRSVSKLHTAKSFQDYMSHMMDFHCNKRLAFNGFGNPYFQFQYEIIIKTADLATGNYISGFQVSREIYYFGLDDRSQPISYVIPESYNPGSKIYPFMANIMRYDLEDLIYTRFHLPRRNSNQYFFFKLMINWNDLLVDTDLSPYTCKTSALSSPPTDVRNFSMHSAITGPNSIEVNITWEHPLDTNGIRSYYQICASPSPLNALEDPTSDSSCENKSNTSTSASYKISFSKFSEVVYLQIRSSNTYRVGNWSYFYAINLPSSDATTISEATALGAGVVAAIALFVIVVVVIAGTLCIVCLVCLIKSLRKRKKLMRQTETMPNYVPMFSVSYAPKETPMFLEMESVDTTVGDEWEISPSDITVDDKLGEGAFGEVYRGTLKGPLINNKIKPEFRNSLYLPVAIKLLKDSARGSERQDFLSEIDMMKKVSEGQNPHVVAMLGCVTTQEPLCLLTEFVQYGDLLSYLRSSRAIYFSGNPSQQEDPYLQLGQLTPADLPSLSYQIAAGMAYLSSIGIVHRDLACRNVLVSADKALKITDFGMSRETEDVYVQKSKGRVPYKWMAIESIIAREFTSASDVWSYGVTLWEIETIGGVPYPGVSNAELLPLLRRGHRMDKPEKSASEVYDIMLSCWQESPSQRPTFNSLKLKFNDILSSHGSNTYVDFCIDPNQLCYKNEEDTDIPPAYKNLLHPAMGNDRRSKANSPAGSLEAVSIRKASASPQGSPRLGNSRPNGLVAKSPSMEKLSTGNLQLPKRSGDRRPNSMMLLKQNQECEHRRRSGIDQHNSGSEDDRYVRDPSAFLNVPQLSLHSGEVAHGRSGAPEVRQAGSDSRLNTSYSSTGNGIN